MMLRTGDHIGFRLSGEFLGISQARMYSLKPLFPELTEAELRQVIQTYSDEIEHSHQQEPPV